jgi:divalent metal cation (Fe/Co/Zn/Cd) transporter
MLGPGEPGSLVGNGLHRALAHQEPNVYTDHDARRVSWASVGWGVVQGAGAVAEGIHTRSLALVGVGVALALDVTSSLVLIWRFHQEDGHLGPEEFAGRVAKVALVVVGLGLIAGSIERLATSSGPSVGPLPLGLALAGLLILPFLARWKHRVAVGVASPALITDAKITAVGAAMSGVTLLGLAVTGLFGWWWADAVAALVIAALALLQLREETAVREA